MAEGQLDWEKQDIGHSWKHKILSPESLKLAKAQNPPSDMIIQADVSLSQPRWIGILCGKFPTEVKLYCGWWGQDQWIKRTTGMSNVNKKPKQNL